MRIRPTMRGRRGGIMLLALVAAVAGLVLIVVAIASQRSAAQPPRAVGRIDGGVAAPTTGAGSPPISSSTGRAPLSASRPQRIAIPAIGVRSAVFPIGLAPDGTLAVPQPGPRLDQVAWFKNSPTPGQPGPAVVEGHVDTTQGPSVFFDLGRLRPGNRILVTRQDGVVAVFTVNAVRDFAKSRFPTRLVYGSHLNRPELRLITCSDFSSAIGHHTGNAVVFAHLTATRPAH